MERLRMEREEWEGEAARERERREGMEEEVKKSERREREMRGEMERAKEREREERERADNLQDVLQEFQSCKFARQAMKYGSALQWGHRFGTVITVAITVSLRIVQHESAG